MLQEIHVELHKSKVGFTYINDCNTIKHRATNSEEQNSSKCVNAFMTFEKKLGQDFFRPTARLSRYSYAKRGKNITWLTLEESERTFRAKSRWFAAKLRQRSSCLATARNA